MPIWMSCWLYGLSLADSVCLSGEMPPKNPSAPPIELHRRVACGFRNRENYRLRTLIIGDGATSPRAMQEKPEKPANFILLR